MNVRILVVDVVVAFGFDEDLGRAGLRLSCNPRALLRAGLVVGVLVRSASGTRGRTGGRRERAGRPRLKLRSPCCIPHRRRQGLPRIVAAKTPPSGPRRAVFMGEKVPWYAADRASHDSDSRAELAYLRNTTAPTTPATTASAPTMAGTSHLVDLSARPWRSRHRPLGTASRWRRLKGAVHGVHGPRHGRGTTRRGERIGHHARRAGWAASITRQLGLDRCPRTALAE